MLAPIDQPSSEGSQRQPAFDALRALSAFLVFLFHYRGFADPRTAGGPGAVEAIEWLAARHGTVGTNLLLMLSGFFLASSFSSARFVYFPFIRARLIRIYVPYLAVILMAVGFLQILPQFSRLEASDVTWQTILQQLLLFPGLFPDPPLLTVTWTLSYIVAGYLFFPIAGLGLRHWKVQKRGRIAAWAGVTLLFILAAHVAGLLPDRFFYIPAGCLLFEIQANGALPGENSRILRKLLVVAALLFLARLFLHDFSTGNLLGDRLVRLVYLLVDLLSVSSLMGMAVVFSQRPSDSFERVPFLAHIAALGQTGYSFYLLHGPIVKVFSLALFPILAAMNAPAISYWLLMPLCWAIAQAAAMLLYQLVEKPCRRLVTRTKSPAGGVPWHGDRPGAMAARVGR